MDPHPPAHRRTARRTTSSDATFRIALSGDIDLARRSDLDAAVAAFLSSPEPDVALDLSAVDFMDSTGLGAVFRLCRIARERGGSVRLVSPNRRVRRALDVSGLAPLCEITD